MLKISDFYIETDRKFTYNKRAYIDYLCDCQKADCSIVINKYDLDYEQGNAETKYILV